MRSMEVDEGDDGREWVWVQTPTDADAVGWGCDESVAAEGQRRPLEVVFTEPAKHWTDAAPIGNGSFGAMVSGGVLSETLQLNLDTLWTGFPGEYTNPDAPTVLSQVRHLVDDGQYADASSAAVGLSGESPQVYQPLGNVRLEFNNSDVEYTAYERTLDLNTANVTVKYIQGGVTFTRVHFSSYPHQVLVTKISADKSGALSFIVSLDSQLDHHSSLSKNRISMQGSCPGKRMGNTSENPKGIQFSAVLDLQIGNGGSLQAVDDTKLKVDGSDWAVILVAASSSFDGPFTNPLDSRKDPSSMSMKTLDAIGQMSFSELYAYHLDDYQSLFNRMTLQLSKGSNGDHEGSGSLSFSNTSHSRSQGHHNTFCEIGEMTSFSGDYFPLYVDQSMVSTEERVKSFYVDEDPSLVELLFHYGRYLLISCSRPGTQIANLQGIWSKDVQPPWSAAPHLNINLPMNYWPSLICNLSECEEPLFDFIASLAVNGRKTAEVNYETRGWVAHQVSDIWAKTSPDHGDPVWALWPMGGAWLCTHLWEHYVFSSDKDFLENTAYPLMKGCASFLLDWLIQGHGGYLQTNPSTSPEHYFVAPNGKSASVSYSSTMDISIIKEVFSEFVSSSKILGRTDDNLVNEIKVALAKLPATQVSGDGSIMEWAQDFEDPDMHHRHLSHLFGLFPGHTITLDKTPDLCKAAANSLYKRGDAGPGWSTVWKMALWARLHNSENTYKLLKQLINIVDPDHESEFEGGLYANLFTAHRTLHSRLMQTSVLQLLLQKCLSRVTSTRFTCFRLFLETNGEMGPWRG